MQILKRFKNKKRHCPRCLKIPKLLFSVSGATGMKLCEPCADEVIERCE